MSDINYSLHKRSGYSDPSPYPEIKVYAPDPYYLELIMDDYAGAVSEFTAINQYLYHYFVLGEHGKELGEMLENIAISEMLHMEILSELIILLGGKPIYRGGSSTRRNFWSGRHVYYGRNLYDMLQADLAAEYDAIEKYEQHIRRIEDINIQKILQRIILDERVHLNLFTEAIKKYCSK